MDINGQVLGSLNNFYNQHQFIITWFIRNKGTFFYKSFYFQIKIKKVYYIEKIKEVDYIKDQIILNKQQKGLLARQIFGLYNVKNSKKE